MIYRASYFKKELRQAYSENRTSTHRKMASAFFLGLFSFALFFVLQTLQQSVLADVVPQIMQPSFFSTLTIYLHSTFIFNTVFFMIYYDYLFFAEIRRNSWYLLIQMGYRPVMMLFSKLFALLYSVFLVYSVGFLITIFLTVFLKYSFILAYMPALYLAGLTDIFLISILSLTFSLYTRTVVNARYWIFLSAVFILVLKITLGQYNILANRVAMQNLSNLFDLRVSPYMAVALAIMVVCLLICLKRAKNLAKYYSLSPGEDVMPAEASVVYLDPRTGKQKPAGNRKTASWTGKIIATASTVFLIVFICAALVFNIFVILINTSTPGQEVTILGVIPFVFKSATMEPEIRINDLAYFQKIDNQYPLAAGDIILFAENSTLYVERIREQAGSYLIVDIDNYPPLSQPGALLKTVPRTSVHGIYIGRNRWLGALILFANTIIGRLVLLLAPAVLLFYHAQIYGYFKKK